MIKKTIIMDMDEYNKLPNVIIANIIRLSKESYGFRMISRETNKEITDAMTIFGLLYSAIEQGLGGIE